MTGPPSEKILSHDSVLMVLKGIERPLSVGEIVKRLKAFDLKYVFASSVRSILYELRKQGLAEQNSSCCWRSLERADSRSEPAMSLRLDPEMCLRPDPDMSMKNERKRSNTKTQEIRTCQRCDKISIPGERFCEECRKEVKAEMDETGYLTRQFRGHVGDNRGAEMRENVYETKHGTGHG